MPIPQRALLHKATVYPFRVLRVGQSFVLEDSVIQRKRVRNVVAAQVSRGRLDPGYEIALDGKDGKLRVWRVA